MPVFDFHEQDQYGAKGEAYLDVFFAERGHQVHEATREQQRRGIDRVFVKDDKRARIEYKTDYIAHKTGHIFVETVSVDTADKAGWAYTSHADMLVYFVPGLKRIFIMRLADLRELLPAWVTRYPERSAQNKGYATHGLLVPIQDFEQHASQVFRLG